MQASARPARHPCARNRVLLWKLNLKSLQLLIAPYLAVPMTPALTQVRRLSLHTRRLTRLAPQTAAILHPLYTPALAVGNVMLQVALQHAPLPRISHLAAALPLRQPPRRRTTVLLVRLCAACSSRLQGTPQRILRVCCGFAHQLQQSAPQIARNIPQLSLHFRCAPTPLPLPTPLSSPPPLPRSSRYQHASPITSPVLPNNSAAAAAPQRLRSDRLRTIARECCAAPAARPFL